MILLDTNVLSETMRKFPAPVVIARLIRHDAELALTAVVIAEITSALRRSIPAGWRCLVWLTAGAVSQIGFLG